MKPVHNPILNAAANTCEDFPGGITGMADALSKNKFSLMHELTACNGAKLGIVDAARIVRRSHDARLLNAFAADCGYQPPLPMPELLATGDDVMRDLARTAREFAQLVAEVSADTSDGEISANELTRIEREWAELVAAGQRLIASARARHEAARPAHLKAA